MKDHFDGDSVEDRKARKIIEAERKAALFDAALAEAKTIPQRLDQVKALTAKVDALTKAVERPVQIEARLKAPHVAKGTIQSIDPVLAVGDAATAEFLRFTKQVDVTEALEKLNPGEAGKLRRKAARHLMTKSATSPASVTSATWAAELVRSSDGGWIESFPVSSVFRAIRAHGGRPIPMGTANSITYPMRSEIDAGAMAAAFTGEGATIPVKQGTFASQTFTRKKAGVITVASNELWRTSVEDLRTILIEMIADDTSMMLDSVILEPSNAAVAGIRPASPWNGAPNQASAGTDLTSIITDLSYLIGAIDRPKKPLLIMDTARALRLRTWRDNMGWVFAPEMDSQGTIFGVPFMTSANVPTDRVYIIDCDDFLSWLPVPEVDMSATATLAMADDSGGVPTMTDTNAVNDAGGSIHISDAAGTIPPTVVRSTYQTDSTALRVVQMTEWGMIRSGRTAYLHAVGW